MLHRELGEDRRSGRAAVTVSYTITGLSGSGNHYGREMSARRFADYIDTWPASIARARAGERQ